MGEKSKVSVFRAIGNGTVYFFRNIHLVLLAVIPMLAITMYLMLGDNGKFMSEMASGTFPPSFFILIAAASIVWMWIFNLMAIHIASKPYILNLGLKNQALLALKRLPGSLAAGIMFGVAAMFCMILLVIPAFVLMCVWSMVIPTYILYGGVFKSFEEGRELVRGHAWSVFFMFFICLVIMAGMLFGLVYSGYIGTGTSIQSQAVSAGFSLAAYVFYFWLLALFKEIKEAKNFEFDADRKGKKVFYKVVFVLTSIGFVLISTLYVYMFTVQMPKIMKETGITTKIEGNKTITYKKGIPVSAVEQKAGGMTAYTYYYESGKVKKEVNMKFLTVVGQAKDYYENGNLQTVQTYEKGKLNGESFGYNEKGRITKKCVYKDGELVGCTEVK
jgi:MFS family permease